MIDKELMELVDLLRLIFKKLCRFFLLIRFLLIYIRNLSKQKENYIFIKKTRYNNV